MGDAVQKRIWNVRKRKQKHKHRTAVFVKQLWWWTGNQCGDEVSKALALMMLLYMLLTTLNLKCDMSALPLMKQNEEHCAKRKSNRGNKINAEAHSLSEALKRLSLLTLILEGWQQRQSNDKGTTS